MRANRFSLSILACWMIVLSLLMTACAQGNLAQATQTDVIQPTPTLTSIASEDSRAAPAASAAEPGCTVVSRQPTPNPTQESLLPPAGEEDWSKGPPDAKVTIIDYSDFQ